MSYPVPQPIALNTQHDDFEQLLVSDFTGGLNITDPIITLPPNQFTSMLNYYYNRDGTIYSRPPYRPATFSANIQDKYVTVDIAGTTYVPSTIHDYKVFRETLSNGWSYNDEVHVVTGVFEDVAGVAADYYVVAVYNSTSETWIDIWSALNSATTSASVVPYKVNQAFDLIIFPNNTNPERWSPTATTGTLTDLGLPKPWEITNFNDATLNIANSACTAPSAGITRFTIAAHAYIVGDTITIAGCTGDGVVYNGTWKVYAVSDATHFDIEITLVAYTPAGGGTETVLSPTLTEDAAVGGEQGRGITYDGTYYYKFSYFYDDKNVTTRFGESSLMSTAMSITITGANPNPADTKRAAREVNFTNLPIIADVSSTISKIYIYRSPAGEINGPYKFIGFTTGTTFTDTVPVGEEGVDALPDGTNPSLSGSELSVLKARTIGAYIVGFDASMPHKLIWSDSGSPDVWNPLNFDYLDDTGVRAIEFNRVIYIFTVASCYQKTTMNTVANKISNIGAIDDRCIHDVGSGLIWLDYDTVYFADFVQQYGSKGDFPLDIGHPISRSIKRRDTTVITNSAFFERRYYLMYTDTEDYIPRTYVFDVDIKAWTQHSARHQAWSRGNTTLFSLGISNSKYYVYEHDYNATVAVIEGASEYSGKDYHDYDYIISPVIHYKFDDNVASTVIVDSTGLSNGTSVENTNLMKGRIAYFKMNDDAATTDVIDDSLNGNDGTLAVANSEDINTAGKLNGTLEFDGAAEFITVPDIAAYNSTEVLSVFLWVNPGTHGDNEQFVSKGSPGGTLEWAIGITGSAGPTARLKVIISDDGTAITSKYTNSRVLSTGTWKHIGFTFERGELKIYVNGAEVTSTTDVGSAATLHNDTGDILIGKYDTTNFFDGLLDDIRIYKTTLSVTEIAQLYNSGTGTEDEIDLDSPADGALYFDGVSDFIDSNNNLSDFITDAERISILFWMKQTENSTACYMYGLYDGTGDESQLRLNQDPDFLRFFYNFEAEGEFSFGNVSSDYWRDPSEGTAWLYDEWHHVGVTLNVKASGGCKFYIDGIYDDFLPDTTDHSAVTSSISFISAQDFYIGGLNDDGSLFQPFNGFISDFRIYNTELTSAEVATIKSSGTDIYGGITTITCSIGRENIKIGGDFRKVFISSLSIEVEGSIISIVATISGQDNDFSTSKTFAAGTDSEVITEYAFVFDESVFANGVGNEAEAGDADEAGFAGFAGDATASLHKKINRIIKSNAVGVVLTSADSRNLSLMYIVLYWKPLPAVA